MEKLAMSLSSLDHCAIRTVKLEATRDFYVEALGMADGDRPDFPFPGNWLYVGGRAVLHLVGIDPDDPSGLEEYLGAVDIEDLDGSGAVDHLAFRAQDPAALIDRLDRLGVAYRERKVPDMDLLQVFLEDPNGVTIELNYFAADA